jgi:uncharacterized Fe-S cluster protein YjdI
MDDIEKKYSNGEVTIVWKPSECIHSTKCWKGLSDVFDPRRRPWITVEKSTTEKIVAQVDKCPSGALSYFRNDNTKPIAADSNETVVETVTDGPLMVHGTIKVKNSSGEITTKSKVTAFCRCGNSLNKPYCDGTHKKIDFKAD